MKFWDVLWLCVAVEIQLTNKDVFPVEPVYFNKNLVNVGEYFLPRLSILLLWEFQDVLRWKDSNVWQCQNTKIIQTER